jgi:ubiquinone/menaquinone biosynthesis C-methylase UbiE
MRLARARSFRIFIPPKLRPAGKAVVAKLFPSVFKYQEGKNYWDTEWDAGRFGNDHYEKTMLALANEPSADFLKGKICADFGCGPMGSLCWATPARARIGIDVMANSFEQYRIKDHDMVYVVSTERKIPLPSNYVDILFTLNALDHVNFLVPMCNELLRILAPGGIFFGSFNLGGPPTFNEPLTLTESALQQTLLRHFEIESYRTAAPGPPGNTYKYFNVPGEPPAPGTGYLWVRAKKRA